jgi:dolichol-phosphate mannosyltransferase
MTGPSRPLLSLVVPTFEERANISELLDGVRAAMTGRPLEVWVVDDDSPDRTWQVADDYGRRHPEAGIHVVRRQQDRGLSSAVIEGFSRAGGEILAVMDADLSHPPTVIPRLADAVAAGADLAVGSRRVPGGGADRWPWYRRRTSDLATALARRWLDVPINDPMSGCFALRRSLFHEVRDRLQPRGYKILLEIACRARPASIVEVPYIFRDRRQGVSKLSVTVALEYLASLRQLRRETSTPQGGR